MLDGVGLHTKLGIDSSRSLFGGADAELLSGTSAIIYPTFINGKSYSGSPDPTPPSLASLLR
jgi:hypothetical protein